MDNAVNWYFSLQNVQDANDRILKFMDRMNLPNIYRQTLMCSTHPVMDKNLKWLWIH